MSYRIAPGHQNHTPFGKALRDYDGSESYKHTVRGINPTSIYDTKYEGYRRREEKQHSLTSVILIVILIVVAIILLGYIVHCWKNGKTSDPRYFDKISVFGGDSCSKCGCSPCKCGKEAADDIFEEIKEENKQIGSTIDIVKGGSDDDYESII